jgi:hypothetical protein
MEPTFGWTLLSPEAIRRAEAQLQEDIEGVRDEIGFLRCTRRTPKILPTLRAIQFEIDTESQAEVAAVEGA